MRAHPAKIMPRPSFPPTPQPSTDIVGKSSADALHLESSFNLPPAALNNRSSASSLSESPESASDSSYHPLSPTSPVVRSKHGQARKRLTSSGHQDDYSLPPPPTRSRKIIQMKPKETRESSKPKHQAQDSKAAAGSATTGTKRKHGGPTNAAGRKTARKTAHSLIERRRRSKMNDEFGTLKDMIPACKGQEMHKLAILQASVEYMRYLEQCIHDLKNARQPPRGPLARETSGSSLVHRHNDEHGEIIDREMRDASSLPVLDPLSQSRCQSAKASPVIYSQLSASVSPAIMPQNHNYSSANTSPALQPLHARQYSVTSGSIRSALTSPDIQPSPIFSTLTPSAIQFTNPFSTLPPSASATAAGSSHETRPFALTSPLLGPQDKEASQALMMLNTDRRSWRSARGMSVKDLLSG